MNKNIIFGKVFKGLGLSSKMGFPTINIYNESKTESGMYFVHHKEFGKGYMSVTPDVAEIHFLNEILFNNDFIKCEIINKISYPKAGVYKNHLSPTDIYYAGVKYIKELSKKSVSEMRKSIYDTNLYKK